MWVGIVHLQTAWLDQEGLPKTLLTGAGKSAAVSGGGESSCKIEWVRKSKLERNVEREMKGGGGERVKFITAKYSKS